MDQDELKELIQQEPINVLRIKQAIETEGLQVDAVLVPLVEELSSLRAYLLKTKARDISSRATAAELGDYFLSNPDLVSGFSYRNGQLLNRKQHPVSKDDLDLVALERKLRLTSRFFQSPLSFRELLIGLKRYFLSVAVTDRHQSETVRECIHDQADQLLNSSKTKKRSYILLSELKRRLPYHSEEDIRSALIDSDWIFDQKTNRQWIFRKGKPS
ncbi:hypothetical protein [Chroococcidiopsis sp.]|uniref:hypothetical protein n=1 Tax=Chroococcidiopsis sp. TaxID=3088168 RepID=UPI003F3ABC80